MKVSTRRTIDWVQMAAAAVVLGVLAVFAAAFGDSERIGTMWVLGEVGPSGEMRVSEVIDYDFGAQSKHGIFRFIPDVDESQSIEVASPTAPDSFRKERLRGNLNLRIGDPDQTVSNRHRYGIRYTLLADSVFRQDSGQAVIGWDAVGAEWPVGIENAEIHVVGTWKFSNMRCETGRFGTVGGCTATQIEDGHLVIEVERLSAGEGVSIFADAAPIAAAPAIPKIPTGGALDPGASKLGAFPVAALAALGLAIPTAALVRRKGREQIWAGGVADSAFGPGIGENAIVEYVDHSELADRATIEFAAPRDVSASAGGIIHREKVEEDHRVAWLVECAIRDEVILEGEGKNMVLKRGPNSPHSAAADTLNKMFGGRSQINLGKYDAQFKSAWESLDRSMQQWMQHSDLWAPVGHRRRRNAIGAGIGLFILGALVAVAGAVSAARSGSGWYVLLAIGAALAGAAAAMLIKSWELLVRSPKGSATWLRIESFRRFIAGSEAHHAEQAAEMGLLREYAAWAVALGEVDRWTKAVESAAANAPQASRGFYMRDLYYLRMASHMSVATQTAATPPQPKGGSGGGGGFGGGVGGGGGGGGGGSW